MDIQDSITRANEWLKRKGLRPFPLEWTLGERDDSFSEIYFPAEAVSIQDEVVEEIRKSIRGDIRVEKTVWCAYVPDEDGDLMKVAEGGSCADVLVNYRLEELRVSWQNDLQPEDFS